MRRESISITGAGPHDVIVPHGAQRILIARLVLTFSHAGGQSLPVTFYSGSTVIAGPFFVLDGGEINYQRAEGEVSRIEKGDAFRIGLADGLSCAGSVEYEVGSW